MENIKTYFALVVVSLTLTLSPHAYSEINVVDYNAVCDGSIDDTDEINSALVAAKTNGGGVVIINFTGNDCITSAPLKIWKNTQLKLEHGVRINNIANEDVVHLMNVGASVVGGSLHNSNASFNKSVILLDTFNIVDNLRKGAFTGAANIEISAKTGFHNGTGINMIADGSDLNTTAIQYTFFDNINIHDLGTCINAEVFENSGELAFINGNMFSQILMEDCVYFIKGHISGTGTPEFIGNKFVNVQIQTDTDSQKAIKLSGGDFARNSWTNVAVWDWNVAASGISIEISGNSVNSFLSLQGVSAGEIAVGDGDNFFVGSRHIPLNIPVLSSVDLPSPDKHVGAIVFINDLGKFVFSNGVHWRIVKFDGTI